MQKWTKFEVFTKENVFKCLTKCQKKFKLLKKIVITKYFNSCERNV